MVQSGIYKHHKGKEYKVIGVVRHSETLEELVAYEQLEDSKNFPKGSLWVRPKEMFEEWVEKEGKKEKRFRFIRKE